VCAKCACQHVHPCKIRLENGILPVKQTVVGSVILSNCWESFYRPVDWTWSMCRLLLRCACVRSCVLRRNKVARGLSFTLRPTLHTKLLCGAELAAATALKSFVYHIVVL